MYALSPVDDWKMIWGKISEKYDAFRSKVRYDFEGSRSQVKSDCERYRAEVSKDVKLLIKELRDHDVLSRMVLRSDFNVKMGKIADK